MMNQTLRLIIPLLLFSCCIGNDRAPDDKLTVLVTIPPQAEMVEKIGKDKVSVITMVPPGAEPHTYEPKPSQLTEAADADAYVSVGSGIEFELAWMDKLLSVNKQMKLINSSSGIVLLESTDPDRPGTDPHVWTSVRNAQIMSINIYQGLSKLDPGNRGYYQANLDRYLDELRALDRDMTSSIKTRENKKFIIYHPSLGYFAHDYGLEQIAVEQEGKEPTPRWMIEVIDLAEKENISIVYASPDFSVSSAETLANEIGGRVVLINPLSKDYTGNMRLIASAFKET